MTPKQQRFVEEYLVDLNATEAAKRTGYSEKTAYAQGQRLLKKAEISAAVEEGRQAMAERAHISQDWVLDQLKQVYDRSMDPDAFSPSAANKSLELLGKHLGTFTDKVENHHTGEVVFKTVYE